MAEFPNDFKLPWPGPINIEVDDPLPYLDCATDLIAANWTDDAAGAAIVERCHPWQIELYAIKVVHGELLNGGFGQFLTNRSGRLAEEAVSGFRNFELLDVQHLLNEVFSHFERPIKRNWLDRINMIARHFDMEKYVFDSVEEAHAARWEYLNEFYKKAAPFFDPFTDRYYELVGLSEDGWGRRGWGVPLCEFVDRHKEIFFRLD
jgi:hypothetical protein